MNYYESCGAPDFKTVILNAFSEGYYQGLKKRCEITIDRTTFYDLGLPSGILWSEPILRQHPYTYVTYELASYSDVCDLPLPTLEDLQELINNCRIDRHPTMVSKDVVVIGPNGKRISIGTQDYRYNGPGSMLCRRKGECVNEYENMFWIEADVVDNCASVAVVNFNDKTISISKAFTGYKLPYILVKK